MKSLVIYVQIFISILLIVSILLQSKGTGLGGAWGGSNEMFTSRRGADKLLFNITIGLAALFLLISIANLLIN